MTESQRRHLLHVFPSFAIGGSQSRFAQLVRLHGERYRHTVVAIDGVLTMAQRLPQGAPVEYVGEKFLTASPIRGALLASRILSRDIGPICLSPIIGERWTGVSPGQNCHIEGLAMIFNIVEIQYSNGDSTYASIVNYCANIDSVITYLRTGLGLPNLPLIQSDYPVLAGDPKKPTTDDYSITGPWAGAIRTLMAQNKLAAQTVPNTVLIPTDSLTMYTEDGLYTHYNHNGDFKWANRVADSICARNWGPVNKCGATMAVSAVKSQSVSTFPSFSRTVFFDGRNWSAFDKAGKSFELFFPNGKVVLDAAGLRLGNGNLRPGIYIIRSNSAK